MWALHDVLRGGRATHCTDSASDGRSPRSRSEVRAPARGPAGMYLALTGGDAEVDESQRTLSRTTLALAAIVLYALATPLFWASAAHAKTLRAAPHATLVSKDHGSDSHDGEHDGSGDGGPDPNAGKGVAGAGNSNTGASAHSNNPAAPSNTSAANANSNTSAQACPAQPSNTSAAQANSNSNTSAAQANSNSNTSAAQANSNSNTGAQANSNTGAGQASNTGAGQANSNTGVQADAKAAHGAKARAAHAGSKAKGVKANAADSNTGVSAASANNSNTTAGAPADQTTNAADNCPPPVTPPVTPPVITPGNNPQPNRPGGPTPTAGSTPVANQPASGVAGVVARSARASLRAQTTCGASAARVTMRVLRVRRVVFSVNGRRVRTVDVAANARTVSVALPLRASGPRRQTVTARVTFRNGQPARTLRVRVTRCAAVRPQFTG